MGPALPAPRYRGVACAGELRAARSPGWWRRRLAARPACGCQPAPALGAAEGRRASPGSQDGRELMLTAISAAGTAPCVTSTV